MHRAIYTLLITAGRLGWLGISLKGDHDLFGFAALPAVAPARPELAQFALEAHRMTAMLCVFLTLLHIAAALYHRLVLRDGVLRRITGSKEHRGRHFN